MQNRLKELRHEKNLTLRELGEKVGMRNSTLSQYETNKREPKLKTWQKLADFFNVPVPYLKGEITYKVLNPLETSIYSHVIEAMNRAFKEYAFLPKTKERVLKAIAYSIDNGEIN